MKFLMLSPAVTQLELKNFQSITETISYVFVCAAWSNITSSLTTESINKPLVE